MKKYNGARLELSELESKQNFIHKFPRTIFGQEEQPFFLCFGS